MFSTPGRPSRGLSTSHSISSSRHRDRDPSRGATATATPRESRAPSPPLPAYEPPIAPLTEPGRQALASLIRSQALRNLTTHIQHVETKLTDSAGEVNERLTEAKDRARKRRERAAARDEDQDREVSRSMTEAGEREGSGQFDAAGEESKAQESAAVRKLEESVKAVTGRLDESMRRAIDSAVRVGGMGDVLGALQGEAEADANAHSQRSRLRRRRREVEEEDEEGEGDLYEASPEPEIDGEEISLQRKLEKGLVDNKAKWEDLSLTERYSTNNDYIGFYRIIHEAKHTGDDIPPVPHASTWFSHLEDTSASTNSSHNAPSRATRNQRNRSTSDANSDDLAIERERISLKCPLTLLFFRDPVTSTKCPHSFEREAIEGMIGQSGLTIPAQQSTSGRGGRRIRAVKCPVCSEVLTNNDLREDPVLVRRVRRHEAAQKRDREEEEEAELGLSSARKRDRKSGIELGSDDEDGQESSRDAMQIDNVRIKSERARSRGVTEATEGRGEDDEGALATESETQESSEEDDEVDDEEGSNEDSDEEMED